MLNVKPQTVFEKTRYKISTSATSYKLITLQYISVRSALACLTGTNGTSIADRQARVKYERATTYHSYKKTALVLKKKNNNAFFLVRAHNIWAENTVLCS